MAYFSSSNYEQYYDNYQFYQPHYNDNVDYHTHESRYVQYGDSYPTQYYNNEFQVAPSQSLVGYYCSNNNNDFFASKNANFHENGDYYFDPVSTQFVISYNISEKEANDLVFEEYNPEPYHGGYDITETYGKALPPSDDICYPLPKINPNLSLPLPSGKEEPKLEGEPKPETNLIGSDEDEDEDDEDGDSEEEDEDEDEDEDDEDDKDGKQEILQIVEGEVKPKSNLIQEENVIDSEEDEDEDEDEDNDHGEQVIMQTFEGGKEGIVSKVDDGNEKEEGNRGKEDGNGKEMRRQIPPGYGMEAIDICEGLFGGYFPCLLKKNKGGSCKQCGGSGVKLRNMDEYECWQGTVDYFFGNPNPYGGSMPEKGSYGDPMLSYQRYYPQESIVGEVKYEENQNSSWLHDYSRYNYGYNGDY